MVKPENHRNVTNFFNCTIYEHKFYAINSNPERATKSEIKRRNLPPRKGAKGEGLKQKITKSTIRLKRARKIVKSFSCFRDVCQLLNSRFQWQSPQDKAATTAGKTRWWHAHLASCRFNAPQKGQRSERANGFRRLRDLFHKQTEGAENWHKIASESLPKDQKGAPGVWAPSSWHWAAWKFPPSARQPSPLAIWHFCIQVGNCFRQAFVQLQLGPLHVLSAILIIQKSWAAAFPCLRASDRTSFAFRQNPDSSKWGIERTRKFSHYATHTHTQAPPWENFPSYPKIRKMDETKIIKEQKNGKLSSLSLTHNGKSVQSKKSLKFLKA